MLTRALIIVGLISSLAHADLKSDAAAALTKAVTFYHTKVAVEGGYVYRYAADLSRREGEGKAGMTTVEVQPPGTPAVGAAMLEAWTRVKDPVLLDAARDAGYCLVRGQMVSGGWTHRIEFAPADRQKLAFRVDGKPSKKARNISSFDDDQTASAIRLMIRLDQALGFKDAKIHESAITALDAVLKNQHKAGGWSQVFDGAHVKTEPPRPASYPAEWPKKYPGGDYWFHYTFNDGAMSSVVEALLEAGDIYKDKRYRDAALRGGEFMLLAQMPEPQPAWAQQYNADMNPAWARKFEPPGISSLETVDVIHTLITLHRATGDAKFLKPIPRAIGWLKKSQLPGGKFSRFYELKTNKPLYMTKDYQLTYEPNDLPTHYGFIRDDVDLVALQREYDEASQPVKPAPLPTEKEVRAIIAAMDARGAWVETATFKYGGWTGPAIQNTTFMHHIDALGRYVAGQ